MSKLPAKGGAKGLVLAVEARKTDRRSTDQRSTNHGSEISSPSTIEILRATARDAPRLPGVYLWKSEEGQIIYIGKAKSLRDRLGSYFSTTKDIKTATLVRHAATIETIIVSNEYEALLLENTLIKQHSPRYNINLKDGKSYPVIRVTNDDFPRIFRTRRVVEDGSLYFGPFPDLKKVDAMLDLIDKLFPLRKCRRLRKRPGPCMYYHIGRCKAPCCGKITTVEYAFHVEQVQRMLSGEDGPLIADLTVKMHEAARELRFEWAARIRNAITAIRTLAGEDSAVVDFDSEGRDYIAWAAEGVLTTFTVFSMRGGKMTGRELFRTRSAADEGNSLEHFITSYYDPARPPPARIYVQPGSEGTGGGASGRITCEAGSRRSSATRRRSCIPARSGTRLCWRWRDRTRWRTFASG